MITVIIPVYNAAETIEKTLMSLNHPLIKQIICVDDGSNDISAEIIEQIKTLPIHLVRQTNQGAAAARNKGMSYVKERYVLFVDSDDYLPEDAIDHYLKVMTLFPDQPVYIGGMSYLDRTGVHLFPSYANFPEMTSTSIIEHPEMLQSIGPAGKLYEFKAIKHLSFDIDTTFCEEHTFNLQVFKQGAVLFNQTVYIYNKLNVHSITALSSVKVESYLKDAVVVRTRMNQLLSDLPEEVKKYYSMRMDKQIIYYLIKNAAVVDKIDEQTLKLFRIYIDKARVYGKPEEINQLMTLLACCAASISKTIYENYIGDRRYAYFKKMFYRMKWEDKIRGNIKKVLRK